MRQSAQTRRDTIQRPTPLDKASSRPAGSPTYINHADPRINSRARDLVCSGAAAVMTDYLSTHDGAGRSMSFLILRNAPVYDVVLQATGAQAITSRQRLQRLWSGYGEILRLSLTGGSVASVVVKHIVLPAPGSHARVTNDAFAHARKVKSYEVEMHWYEQWSSHCDGACRVPRCLATHQTPHESMIVLEDLNSNGFAHRKSQLTLDDIQACLRWLAHFHARFIGDAPCGLWPNGTYWHLATRPAELASLQHTALKRAAVAIDQRLDQCQYKTLVHGDAKQENFCFSADNGEVAAVDFQYVGGGCGMKDVAYFLDSCLTEAQCHRWQDSLLDHYFAELSAALAARSIAVDIAALEAQWRALFPFAWTDFYRFLLGWSPQQYTLNGYAQQLADQVFAQLG
jgi:hypothetical protein